jgi:DNA-binding transcriptional LysR family regulator
LDTLRLFQQLHKALDERRDQPNLSIQAIAEAIDRPYATVFKTIRHLEDYFEAHAVDEDGTPLKGARAKKLKLFRRGDKRRKSSEHRPDPSQGYDRSFALLPPADALRQKVDALLSAYDRLVQFPFDGHFTLSCSGLIFRSLIASKLRKYRDHLKAGQAARAIGKACTVDVRVLENRGWPGMLKDLEQGPGQGCDFAVGEEAPEGCDRPKGFIFSSIGKSFEFVSFWPVGSPTGSISQDDLCDQVVCFVDSDRRVPEEVATRAYNIVRVNTYAAAITLTRSGACVSLSYRLNGIGIEDPPGVVVRRVRWRDPIPPVEVGVWTRPGGTYNPAADYFIKLLAPE